MYAAKFGLSQPPFSIAPDPRFLYMSERHREALAHLLYGIQGGGGFVLLTGAVGAGKTTVARCFVEQLPSNCRLAYVFNPQLTARELLRTICGEFGIEVIEDGSMRAYIEPLNRFLLEGHAAGRNAVLIIDEAQILSSALLEQLRLLTNLETDSRKLLQIILIGQPELRDRLAAPGKSQLSQRVIARYHLEALGPEETAQYVRHRLAVAGLTGAQPFGDRALRQVYRLSRGVPRRINLLCDRALLGAYAQGRQSVDVAMVRQAAREAFDEPRPRRTAAASSPARWGLARVLTAAVVVGGLAGVGVAALLGVYRADLGPRVALPGPAASAAAAGAGAGAGPSTDAAAARAVPAGAVNPGLASAAGAAADAATTTASAAAASAPALPPELDATALYARTLWPDEAAAWRALASLWGPDASTAAPPGRDACAALAVQGLSCHRSALSLAVIRQIDRPGWLPLQTAAGPAVPALLTALDDQRATLWLPEGPVTVSLDTLASRWGGEFATLWRRPPVQDTAAWVEAQLAQLQAGVVPAGTPLRARIQAFQRAQGLPADGRAGPLTLMQINRATAVAEPRLSGER